MRFLWAENCFHNTFIFPLRLWFLYCEHFLFHYCNVAPAFSYLENGEEVPGSIPVVAARSLLFGSVSV